MKKTLLLLLAAFMSVSFAYSVDFDAKACVTPHSEIFVSGLQRFVSAKNKDSSANKVESKPTSVAIGYQYVRDRWTTGLSLSYETGNRKIWDDSDDEFAKVRDRMFGFTLFGTYQSDCGYYVKSSAFLGFARTKVRSGYIGPDSISERGRDSSTRFGASIELGKEYAFGNDYRITPHVGFDYSYLPSEHRDYTVAGAAGRWNSVHQNFYEIPVGVTFAKDFVACDWVITPSVDLTFVPSVGKMKRGNMNIRTGFASRTGSEWKVYGIGADHCGGRVKAGIRAVKSERFDIDVNYAYEGRKKYHDHRISATLGFGF